MNTLKKDYILAIGDYSKIIRVISDDAEGCGAKSSAYSAKRGYE